MAFALLEEQPLDDDAAERRQVDDPGVLDAVAETAARSDHGVFEVKGPDGDGEVHGQAEHDSENPRFITKKRRIRRQTKNVLYEVPS